MPPCSTSAPPELRKQQRLPQAMAEFRTRSEIDSSSFLAQDELRHTRHDPRRSSSGRRRRSSPGTKLADRMARRWSCSRSPTPPLPAHDVNATRPTRPSANWRDSINHRSGLQAAEDFGRSRGCDHPRSVGHGSPPVETFWLPCWEHDFLARIRPQNAKISNRTSCGRSTFKTFRRRPS